MILNQVVRFQLLILLYFFTEIINQHVSLFICPPVYASRKQRLCTFCSQFEMNSLICVCLAHIRCSVNNHRINGVDSECWRKGLSGKVNVNQDLVIGVIFNSIQHILFSNHYVQILAHFTKSTQVDSLSSEAWISTQACLAPKPTFFHYTMPVSTPIARSSQRKSRGPQARDRDPALFCMCSARAEMDCDAALAALQGLIQMWSHLSATRFLCYPGT